MEDIIKPKLHPKIVHQVVYVGREKVPLIVIDNFLEDAESLIEFCVASAAFNNADSFYPGLRMPAPKLYIQAIHYYLGSLLDATFGLKKDMWQTGRSLYSMVVTPPAQLKVQQCIPHIDSFNRGDLACVHFLCDESKGGTSLYRHKKTGFEYIDPKRLEEYNQCVIAQGGIDIQQKSYMNGSTDLFEQIACIDAKFNRLVIYPGSVLHSGNIAPDFSFDPDPKTGRLTLNSFITRKETNN